MVDIVGHLEQFLGPITIGWSKDADGNRAHAHVLKFDHGPIDGVAAYSTLGLSHHQLALPGKEPVRIELLIMVRKGMFERYVPSLTQQLVEEMIRGGQAPLRGEVIGLRGPIDPATRLEAFFVYNPVYLPDEFDTCQDPDGPIIVVWLIPLFREEAGFAGTHGGEALAALLLKHDPDLTDWLRPPLPVHDP
jgi:hypothetical protein